MPAHLRVLYRRTIRISGNIGHRARGTDPRTDRYQFVIQPDRLDTAIRRRRRRLKRRRLGYSVPGFHSGHYVLNDGSKGFALLTDRQRALVIPLKDGSVVMLSMAEPKALLAALRTAAAAG